MIKISNEKTSSNNNHNRSNNLFEVKCPYCRASAYIDSEGSWRCNDCKDVFIYRNKEVYKKEDVCSDRIIHITALLAKLAKADGIVSEEEVSVLSEIFKKFQLNTEQQKEAGQIFNKEKLRVDHYENHIYKLKELIQEKELLRVVIECMFMITMVDGNFNIEQEKMILKAVSIFGLSSIDYEEIKSVYVEDLVEYYKILGCNNKSTDEDIKKAYRNLMIQYHPDKYVSKDLPQEILDHIVEKCKKIQEAYSMIESSRKKLKSH